MSDWVTASEQGAKLTCLDKHFSAVLWCPQHHMFEGLGIKPVTRLCRPSIKWCPLWWRCLRMSPHLRRGPRRSSGRWTPTEMVCLIFVHHLLQSFSFVTVCTYTFRLYTVALRSTWTTRQQLKAWRTARDQSVAWVRGGQDLSKKSGLEERRNATAGKGGGGEGVPTCQRAEMCSFLYFIY